MRGTRDFGAIIAVLLSATFLAQAGGASFEITLVDPAVHGYATFQSHNQKVLANQHGYFLTHLCSRNEAYTAQRWRLLRSTDQGQTFSVLYEATHATNPPPIETDGDGNVYLARPDFLDGNAYLYRFDAVNAFRDPAVSVIPGGAAGKVALLIDPLEPCLYYASHNNQFYKLALDGTVLEHIQILAPGPNALLQYPLLRLDSTGSLHYAWTSQKHGEYLYWDIHHLYRRKGEAPWRNLGGQAVALPVAADDTGPATRVSLDTEFDVHTWLSGFTVKGGKAHFLYLSQSSPWREYYVRRDLETGMEELRVELDGIRSLSGLLVAPDTTARSPLYAVGAKDRHVVALVSHDNGTTWSPYALSEGTYNVYSLGGCNTITKDGYILGSFTDQGCNEGSAKADSRVYFFRLSAG